MISDYSDRPSHSIARAAAVSAVPLVTAASETVAMRTTVAFGTNTRQPWSLAVTNGIAGGGLAVVGPHADDQNRADQGDQPGEYRLQCFLGGAVHIGAHKADGCDEV
jgi:hypothetical protein